MAIDKSRLKYIPGTYAKKRPDSAQLAGQYINEWSQKQLKMKDQRIKPLELPPAICFSRKIGAGALEIADLVAEKINYRVVDRELLDHMANDQDLSKKTIEFSALSLCPLCLCGYLSRQVSIEGLIERRFDREQRTGKGGLRAPRNPSPTPSPRRQSLAPQVCH